MWLIQKIMYMESFEVVSSKHLSQKPSKEFHSDVENKHLDWKIISKFSQVLDFLKLSSVLIIAAASFSPSFSLTTFLSFSLFLSHYPIHFFLFSSLSHAPTHRHSFLKCTPLLPLSLSNTHTRTHIQSRFFPPRNQSTKENLNPGIHTKNLVKLIATKKQKL